MREDYVQKGLSSPDEDIARSQYLDKGISTSDLVTVKDFLQFYITISHLQVDKDKLTADAICTISDENVWHIRSPAVRQSRGEFVMIVENRALEGRRGPELLSLFSTSVVIVQRISVYV